MATSNRRGRPVKPRPTAAPAAKQTTGVQVETPVLTDPPAAPTPGPTPTSSDPELLDVNNLPDPEANADAPETGTPEQEQQAPDVTDMGAPPAPPETPEDAEDERDTTKIDDLDDTEYRRYWQKYLDDSGVTPPDGRILFPGEPLTFEGHLTRGDIVVLSHDVYRMVIAFRSITPSFTLEARAGTEVPKVRVVTKSEYRRAVGGLFDAVMEG